MPSPLTVVIFGASGDLTSRKLIPALFNLARKKKLPPEARVLGVARTAFSDDAFREMLGPKVKDIMTAAGETWDEAEWTAFASRIHYVPADTGKPGGIAPLKAWFDANEGAAGGRRLYYFSVSPELYPQLSDALGEAGMQTNVGGFRSIAAMSRRKPPTSVCMPASPSTVGRLRVQFGRDGEVVKPPAARGPSFASNHALGRDRVRRT